MCAGGLVMKTVAAMATMPGRLEYLEQVVATLRPQVDVLRVYLNEFDEIPDFLQPGEGVLSSEANGDLGDAGKFYWLDDSEGHDYTHYLTVDDDISYPDNYVQTLVREFDGRGGKAIVGVHGSEFSFPIEDFVTSRKVRYRFYEKLAEAKPVHLLGTATVLFSKETLQLSLDDFQMRNAGDIQLAIAAQRQCVPMIAISRPENWLTELRPWTAEGFSIWKSTKSVAGASAPHTHLIRSAIERWQLFDDFVAVSARERTI